MHIWTALMARLFSTCLKALPQALVRSKRKSAHGGLDAIGPAVGQTFGGPYETLPIPIICPHVRTLPLSFRWSPRFLL